MFSSFGKPLIVDAKETRASVHMKFTLDEKTVRTIEEIEKNMRRARMLAHTILVD